MSTETKPPTKSLTLYFDVVSPYAYMAYTILTTSPIFLSAEKSGALTLTFIPIHLSTLIAETKNQPPMATPAKGRYTRRDMMRQASRFRIPIISAGNKPKVFPFRTIDVMRGLMATTMLRDQGVVTEETFRKLVAELYAELWVWGEDLSMDETRNRVFDKVLGREVSAKVWEMLKTDEVKGRLVKNTEDMKATGAFGVPWMVGVSADGKKDYFWGLDHIAAVAEFLELEWPKEVGEEVEIGRWKKAFRSLL